MTHGETVRHPVIRRRSLRRWPWWCQAWRQRNWLRQTLCLCLLCHEIRCLGLLGLNRFPVFAALLRRSCRPVVPFTNALGDEVCQDDLCFLGHFAKSPDSLPRDCSKISLLAELFEEMLDIIQPVNRHLHSGHEMNFVNSFGRYRHHQGNGSLLLAACLEVAAASTSYPNFGIGCFVDLMHIMTFPSNEHRNKVKFWVPLVQEDVAPKPLTVRSPNFAPSRGIGLLIQFRDPLSSLRLGRCIL
mmetsp:Transcript_51110/g.91794  ORF Transcript_51110/g.91794 Transcript_51110/m.91794 type:complete len:243 (-) Transcript_51110:351-1079(-)